MKKSLLILIFPFFAVATFSQELKDPTMRAPFTESSGNFLVLTTFDKIGKSDITIDYIKNLQRDLNESKKLISEQQKQLKEQEKQINDLKKSIDKLTRNVEELQRKVK